MLPSRRFKIYGGTGHHDLDKDVLDRVNQMKGINLEFSHIDFDDHPDFEPDFELEDFEDAAGKHVIVFGSIYSGELELEVKGIVMGCTKQYGAKSLTLIMPFLRYRRQDHKEFRNEITRLRLFMAEMAAWGVTHLITCEPHNETATREYAEEFGIRLFIADPTDQFANKIGPKIRDEFGTENTKWLAADLGSVERTARIAQATGTGMIALPKGRINHRVQTMRVDDFLAQIRTTYPNLPNVEIICDVAAATDKHTIIREDEFSTGGTAKLRGMELREVGTRSNGLVVTHPICAPGWKRVLFPRRGEQRPFDHVWFGNTRPRGRYGAPPYKYKTDGKIQEVDMSPVIAPVLLKVMEEHLKD